MSVCSIGQSGVKCGFQGGPPGKFFSIGLGFKKIPERSYEFLFVAARYIFTVCSLLWKAKLLFCKWENIRINQIIKPSELLQKIQYLDSKENWIAILDVSVTVLFADVANSSSKFKLNKALATVKKMLNFIRWCTDRLRLRSAGIFSEGFCLLLNAVVKEA